MATSGLIAKGSAMVIFLGLVGIVAWPFTLVALYLTFNDGTDIQLILAGVYGTCGAVCLGAGSIIEELQKIRRKLDQGAGASGTNEPSSTVAKFGPSGEKLG